MTADFHQALNGYLTHLSEQRRMSAHTVKNYRRDLQTLIAFCQRTGLSDWSALTAREMRQCVAELHRQDYGARSIQRFLSSARGLFRYLVKHQLASQNPAEAVQAPRASKRLPKTLDVDQMNALLDHTPDDTLISSRDRAIMEVFYSSGLRLAELAALNLRDIDFQQKQIDIRLGKGGKPRIVPIGAKAVTALQTWLDRRDRLGYFSEPALFITQQGKRLGVRSIQKRLKHWGQQQAISDNVHPHRLRHAFASHMLESSGDLRAVQELLGHADISTTQIYTHLDFQHLANVYDAAHPRAKKRS